MCGGWQQQQLGGCCCSAWRLAWRGGGGGGVVRSWAWGVSGDTDVQPSHMVGVAVVSKLGTAAAACCCGGTRRVQYGAAWEVRGAVVVTWWSQGLVFCVPFRSSSSLLPNGDRIVSLLPSCRSGERVKGRFACKFSPCVWRPVTYRDVLPCCACRPAVPSHCHPTRQQQPSAMPSTIKLHQRHIILRTATDRGS